MQVIEKSNDGLKRAFNVVINADVIEAKIASRLNEVGQQVRLPGFRPGKVPMNLLKQRFGQSVRGEVLERTIDESTQAALTQKAAKPAMQPKVELVKGGEEGQDLEFNIQFEVLPEIGASDFSNLELTRQKAVADEKGFDEAIERFLRGRRTLEKTDEVRPAKKGDALKVDFVGRMDGEVFEGGSMNDAVIEIGANQFIPGFEEQLIGAKAGDTLTVKVNFPESYPNAPQLAGKPAEFEVTVKELQVVTLPVLDDALAKTVGIESADILKQRVREDLQQSYDNAGRLKVKRELLDKLADTYSFQVPEGLVDVEFNAIWRQMDQLMKNGQLEDDDKDKSEDDLRKEYRDIAERRVRLGLLLSDVGQKNNVTVTQDDLRQGLSREAAMYPGQEMAVLEYYQRNPQALESLRAPIFEDKVVDYILSQAKITDQPVSVEEIMRDPDDDSEESPAPEKKKSAKKAKAEK
jgi:trigger factor